MRLSSDRSGSRRRARLSVGVAGAPDGSRNLRHRLAGQGLPPSGRQRCRLWLRRPGGNDDPSARCLGLVKGEDFAQQFLPCGHGPSVPAAPALPTCSKLGRRHHETKSICAPAQRAVERHQSAPEDLRQRDVLGVIGSPPTELLGESPGGPSNLAVIDAANRAAFEPLVLEGRVLSADLAVQQPEVDRRASLRPHQRGGDEIVIAQRFEALGATDRGDRDGGVDDEGQRRPRRASCSNATQFGCGVPSSKFFQVSGRPTTLSSASGSSTTMIRARGTWGSLNSSTSRCSWSRVAMPASLAPVLPTNADLRRRP